MCGTAAVPGLSPCGWEDKVQEQELQFGWSLVRESLSAVCLSAHLSLCLVCGRDTPPTPQQRTECGAAQNMPREPEEGNVTLSWDSPLEGVLPAWPGVVSRLGWPCSIPWSS